jgi:adenylate cyclase
MQSVMAERNSGPPERRRMLYRIGINIGDVMIDGDDIYGDGVNVAARLEALAEPGGVTLSDDVHRQVRDRSEVVWTDGGEHEVKNIARSVQVWRGSPAEPSKATAREPADQPSPPPDKPTIAVLPFENMSGDAEQEYFAGGITEDIIAALSYFRELSVISRNSCFIFKGKATTVRDVREQLKADYVVEGSIRKAGNRVRITAQLIDAKTDSHIWAERYDRDLVDIFEVQDDVVRRVAVTLVGRLEHERQERTKRQSDSQLRAYDLYLRARELSIFAPASFSSR